MRLSRREILAAFAEMRQPMRARDLCQALDLDLDIIPKNIESTRHKLKRLVDPRHPVRGRARPVQSAPGVTATKSEGR
ncbi:hypothetical protein ACF07B_08490 [Streptomyces sp. NPDC015532]|uniref:hypothetical protein n=1 Tax=Streptomyces sp. NPDC015532 TaxID=3364960 RepID=UPI0036FA7DEE